jgi:hypothetical protein
MKEQNNSIEKFFLFAFFILFCKVYDYYNL